MTKRENLLGAVTLGANGISHEHERSGQVVGN
jgi:hypothetical protein